MWKELRGSIKRWAGSSGNVDLPAGAAVIYITAHATSAGSVTLWDQVGGAVTVPIPANTWFVYDPKHQSSVANTAGSTTSTNRITFTSTDSYFVEAVSPTGF